MRGATTKIALASAENVTEAARKLIQECVIRRRGGEAAIGIGRVDQLYNESIPVVRFLEERNLEAVFGLKLSGTA